MVDTTPYEYNATTFPRQLGVAAANAPIAATLPAWSSVLIRRPYTVSAVFTSR